MNRENLESVLELAVRAPSGDNAQPWRFVFDAGETLRLYVDSKADTSLYNDGFRAAYIALGAVIENVCIAALHSGYAAKVTYIGDGEPEHVADIRFVTAEPADDGLFAAIAGRESNRKPYMNQEIPPPALDALRRAAEGEGVSCTILTGKLKDAAAEAASANERTVLENGALSSFLFGHITWTDAEDLLSPGFFFPTLELRGPQTAAFRLLRHPWPRRILAGLGIARLVSRDNAILYRTSPAIIAFAVADQRKETYVLLGRSIQRTWLTATRLGLAAQPLAGITLLAQRIGSGTKEPLADRHVALIERAYARIQGAANTKRAIPFLLRVGFAEQPSARTRRKKPRIDS